jgi:hypothetical protein
MAEEDEEVQAMKRTSFALAVAFVLLERPGMGATSAMSARHDASPSRNRQPERAVSPVEWR